MMKAVLCTMLAAGALFAQGPAKTYTGVITDTMCGADHAHMGVNPESKCVIECVKNGGGKYKYALLVGKDIYVLSDQQSPERFAAKKVTVTGVLYAKTGVLKVARIAPAR